ncbi:F510_1955 family glycosylhydrolase [Virgibacillus oceani]|uniref:Glycosyl hydrolase n=1 Tax=Virgibacillus oceani TaxID=1479511 RepID=A0A917HN70_9BACI|nr:hypothetical protein [Virgibacillus oceani]GGG85168.1 hypothetical protein GCM10011398_33650 [Virgibacillus oceani]
MKKAMLYFVINFILFIVPFKVLAHGANEHTSEKTVNYWGYGFIASLVVLIVFVALFILTRRKINSISLKRKKDRDKHQLISKRSTIYKWISIIFLLITVFLAVMANVNTEDEITFRHFHGLGYTSDGEELYVPAHDGLRVYKDGIWTIPTEGEKHDYMGFSMFKGGFYSSGHPAPNSNLANPLGIIKSTDKGKTIEKLDLYGEVDFHGMTVGYETQEIYVFNPMENSRMDQPGFYYSTDKTKTWHKSELKGTQGQALALAAHPTKEGVVAVATDQGVFLSNDHGNNFEKLPVSDSVSAVSFDHQNYLLVATKSNGVKLIRINLATNDVNEINIPNLDDDAIAYVKQNPVKENEFVVATNRKDIYFTHDGGQTWEKSVDDGVAVTH